MKPPAEDPGAHGGFDEIAHRRSAQRWLSRHRGAVAATLAATAAGAAGLIAANRT